MTSPNASSLITINHKPSIWAVNLARVAAIGIIVVTWVYIILRSRPMPDNDYQAFLLVGSRLAQGERLYIDSWDNKDPLTYWVTALVSQSYPFSSHIVELVWFVTIAVATYFIARAFQIAPLVASLAGGVLGPLAMMNLAYFQGATELPGIALTLASLSLVMRKHFVFAGLLLGALLFFKLVFIPVAFTAILCWIVTSKELKNVKEIAFGFIASSAIFFLILTLRGEISGYFETFRMNMLYSNAQLKDGTSMQLADAFGTRVSLITEHQLAGTLLISLVVFSVAVLLILRHKVTNHDALMRAWVVSSLSFVASVIILFITAKLSHHILLMGFPIILASLTVISVAQNWNFKRVALSKPWRLATASFATLLLSYVATGVMAPLDHKFLAESGWDRINTEITEGAAAKWLRSNRDLAEAPIGFLGRGRSVPITSTDLPWKLGCRFTGQGPTSSDLILNQTLECLSESDVVIIGVDAIPSIDDGRYNRFLDEAFTLLRTDFYCTKTVDIEVCLRIGLNSEL
jgi:hypothetical protein